MTWRGWETYAPTAPATVKRSKYGAVKTAVEGITFHSKREAARYVELSLQQRGGAIHSLTLQKQFALHVVTPSGVRVCIGRYIADFAYSRDGCDIVEDVKGMSDTLPLYRWKVAHLLAEYGIAVDEVR